MPEVNMIITLYNHDRYNYETIQVCLNQTHLNTEIIIRGNIECL